MNTPAEISDKLLNQTRLDLFAQAALSKPNDEASVRRYANAAVVAEDIDASIAALTTLVSISPEDADAWCALSGYLLKHSRSIEAEEAARRAVRLQGDNSQFLAIHALALRALHRSDEADLTFEKAFAADPTNYYAIRGVGQILISKCDFAGLKHHIETAIESIGPMSWIVAQYLIALAMLGDHKLLAALIDYDRHIVSKTISTPDGFSSMDQFNNALITELEAIQETHFSGSFDVLKEGQRIQGGIQKAVDVMGKQGAPASHALLGIVNQQLEMYLQQLNDALLVRYRPRNTFMNTDAIVSSAQTSLTPHTHSFSWVNMVYYVEVPDCIKEGSSAGCMEFCPPLHKANIPKGCWPSQVITPQPGKLVLFPGFLCHSVNAMAASGRRIAIAFDIYPTRDSLSQGTKMDKWLKNLVQE